MLRVTSLILLGLCSIAVNASAQSATPTATAVATAAPTGFRLLSCQRGTNKIVFSHCGVIGCTAVVTDGVNAPKSYRVVRTKNSDGSLTYAARAGTTPKCTATVSALRYGTRRLLSATCAPALKNAGCDIK